MKMSNHFRISDKDVLVPRHQVDYLEPFKEMSLEKIKKRALTNNHYMMTGQC